MKISWMSRWLGCLVIAIVVALNVQTKASAQTFTDVGPNHSYQDIIQDMQARGFINGYPDGTFRPNNNITRAHVAVLLDKVLPLEAKTNEVIRYKDVPPSHTYYKEIMKASQAGIFSGDPKGNFNPNAPITRKQMAKVLDLAFELNIETSVHFPDVEYDWGYMHIQALYSNGVTTGNNGYFNPNAPVTRAHYATFLHRALNIPTVPNADPNAALSQKQIVNLIYRLPFQSEITMVAHKSQGLPFSKVRTELLNTATQEFTDTLLKRHYAIMCTECDMFLFPFIGAELDYRFEVLENTPNSVRIRTVSFANIMDDAYFVEYAFKKEAGKWKVAEYDTEPIGAGGFNLTKEEALQIVVDAYDAISVMFLDSEYEYEYDWYTDREYRRLVYYMYVETEEGDAIVYFYPHSGFFDEEY